MQYDRYCIGLKASPHSAKCKYYIRTVANSIIKRYWQYYRQCKNLYKIQGPFAYDFLSTIMDTTGNYYAWQQIESARQNLLKSHDKVTLTDYGAGSRTTTVQVKTIRQIAKTSVSPRWQCQQLFRAVKALAPNTILEMGTSLGISSAYLSTATSAARFITLEGDPHIARVASDTHKGLALDNIEINVGPFSETLAPALADLGRVDVVFIDGHHSYQPTIDYTAQILPYIHDKTVLIYDDIYWSDEMLAAWHELKQLGGVYLSIDTFAQGYLFFDPALTTRQDIVYCPYWLKPWQLGIFQ